MQPVQTLNVYVPKPQKGDGGWFRGFKAGQNGYFKDSVSATLIEMLKKSISVDCNSSNNNNNSNDTFERKKAMKKTHECTRKTKISKKQSHCRSKKYTLRRSIRNQRETRQG